MRYIRTRHALYICLTSFKLVSDEQPSCRWRNWYKQIGTTIRQKGKLYPSLLILMAQTSSGDSKNHLAQLNCEEDKWQLDPSQRILMSLLYQLADQWAGVIAQMRTMSGEKDHGRLVGADEVRDSSSRYRRELIASLISLNNLISLRLSFEKKKIDKKVEIELDRAGSHKYGRRAWRRCRLMTSFKTLLRVIKKKDVISFCNEKTRLREKWRIRS